MPTYRKLPVKIEAFRLSYDDPEQWYLEAIMSNDIYFDGDARPCIPTLEGTMRAAPGDWILKGISGEIYPCKHEIFIKTYEAVL